MTSRARGCRGEAKILGELERQFPLRRQIWRSIILNLKKILPAFFIFSLAVNIKFSYLMRGFIVLEKIFNFARFNMESGL